MTIYVIPYDNCDGGKRAGMFNDLRLYQLNRFENPKPMKQIIYGGVQCIACRV